MHSCIIYMDDVHVMLAFILAVQLSGAAFETAKTRDNPTVAQAIGVVNESIRRAALCETDPPGDSCEPYGDVLIRHVFGTGNGSRRSECIIESARRLTCVRSTQISASHFNFAPPHVFEVVSGDLPVAAIVAAERAWVGLAPLPADP